MKILYISLLMLSSPWVLSQSPAAGVLQGRVTFGDWVLWGKTTVPEGSYSITVEYVHAPVKVIIRSAPARTNVFVPTTILAGTESGHDQVCLLYQNNRWNVRSVDLPELGISLLFLPRNQQSTTGDERSKCQAIELKNAGGI